MTRILIAYSTTDGHTIKICERLKQVVDSLGDQADIAPVAELSEAELRQYDKIAIGASIRYGKHQPEVYSFIATHQLLLETKPSAFFTVNVVARKPEKNTPDTNPYLVKFLKQIDWQPRHLDVFAGRINYSMYGLIDRNMIRFIMWMTKGPTAADTDVEFTDWGRVDAFGKSLTEIS